MGGRVEREKADDLCGGGCSLRLQARRKNRGVTELGEGLARLPLGGGGEGAEEVEAGVPRTGGEIRRLNRGCPVSFFGFASPLILGSCSLVSHFPGGVFLPSAPLPAYALCRYIMLTACKRVHR